MFKADFKELKESAKARKSALNRLNNALARLEKLIKETLSNRLAEVLKYIKAEHLNVGHLY